MAKKKGATQEGGPAAVDNPHQVRRDLIEGIQKRRLEELKTETGVEIGHEPELVPEQEVARQQAMAAEEEESAEEGGKPEKPEKKETAEGEPEEEPEKEKPGEGEEEPPEKETASEKEPSPEEEMVEITVDGQKQQVPLSQIRDAGIRTLQKETAADKRLQEATEKLQGIDRTVAEAVDRRLAEWNRQETPHPSRTETEESETEDGGQPEEPDFKTLAYDLQYGDEETAAEALRQLRGSFPQPSDEKPLTKQELLEAVDDHFLTRQITQQFNAPPEQGGFSDIANDPRLFRLANDRVNQLLSEGEPDTWATYEKAGKEIREWANPMLSGGQTKVEVDTETRKTRKKETETAKGAAASATKETEEPATPPAENQNVSETLKQMRRARGQAV